MPEIQRVINAAFAPVMTGDADGLQADYVPLRAVANRYRAAGGRRAAGSDAVRHAETSSAMAIEESLPDAVGAFVDWLVDAAAAGR